MIGMGIISAMIMITTMFDHIFNITTSIIFVMIAILSFLSVSLQNASYFLGKIIVNAILIFIAVIIINSKIYEKDNYYAIIIISIVLIIFPIITITEIIINLYIGGVSIINNIKKCFRTTKNIDNHVTIDIINNNENDNDMIDSHDNNENEDDDSDYTDGTDGTESDDTDNTDDYTDSATDSEDENDK
jgi:hypothetical protein